MEPGALPDTPAAKTLSRRDSSTALLASPALPLQVKKDENPIYFATDQNQDIVISAALYSSAFVPINYNRARVVRAAQKGQEASRRTVELGEQQGYILYRCDATEAYLIGGRAGLALREALLRPSDRPRTRRK